MKSLEKHIVKYGVSTALALIAYFFLMQLLGLVHNIELRVFNGFIMFGGAFLALRKFKKEHFKKPFSYYNGLFAGVAVVVTTTVLFTIFVIAYLFADPAFMQAIVEREPLGVHLNELAIGMVIFIEGTATGVVFSFVTMQYLKDEKDVRFSSQ